MTDKLLFDFGKVFIYDNYLVVIINEGVTLIPSYNEILLNIVDTYYRKKDFVYLTHRKNSYSVDPAIYKETSKIKNLAGFAVVTENYKAKSTAEIEKLFLNKPFQIFDHLDEAVQWASTILNSDQTIIG